ncbi:MAG TPA: hypothetical protein VJB89_04000 [Candidatus Nanoarchaeia archaeon]|nr:hypothetical protein [Candidatus Nanoarchaeia archaeon]
MNEYYEVNGKDIVRCDNISDFNYAVAFTGSNRLFCFKTTEELGKYLDSLRRANCECYYELLFYERVEDNGDSNFKSNGTVLEARLINLSQAN